MLSRRLIIFIILLTATISQTIICTETQSCSNDKLTCNNGKSCSLICNGSIDGEVCKNVQLDGSLASNVTVYCTYSEDCRGTTITCGTGICHVYCQSVESCRNQKLFCGTGHCILECMADESCLNVNIDTTFTPNFLCIGNYCPSTSSPTILATTSPTILPSALPTASPTILPTSSPTILPTASPTILPTTSPTITISPTIIPSNMATYSPTKQPRTRVETTVYPTWTPTTTTQNEDELTERDDITTLLVTWQNLVYVLVSVIMILCSIICGYALCKRCNKSKNDGNDQRKIYDHVEMAENKKKITNLEGTKRSETNEFNTNTTICTNGLHSNNLKTIITPPMYTEGEQNDESVQFSTSMNNNMNVSYQCKHGMLNDSVTITEGLGSTTNQFDAETINSNRSSFIRSRVDTLENILCDVINEDHEIEYDENEKSYIYNIAEEEKSVSVQYKQDKERDNNIKLILYDFDQTITKIHLYRLLNGGDLKMISNEALIEIFGGNERIEKLNQHFNILRCKNIKIGILSFGFSKVIEQALYRINMLKYFNFIIGRDSEEMKISFGEKAMYIENLTKTENYNKCNVLFIDDDPKNIEAIIKKNCCLSMLIQPRNGMNEQHLKQIENKCIHS